MAKRKKKSGGGADWMNTYGDLVTLLFCFFVLLYAISSVDQEKFANLVKSLNPKAVSEIPENAGNPQGDTGTEAGFSKLYESIVEEMKKEGLDEEDVEVKRGQDYIFISHNDKVIFDGDSAIIKPEGRRVLDTLCRLLKPMKGDIKEVRVLGHTTQIIPGRDNNVEKDRHLASERATNVVIYMQNKNVLPPGALVSVGYGQFHPIGDIKTSQGRSKNRRSEILITEKGSSNKSVDEYHDELYGDEKKADNKKKTEKTKEKSKDGKKKKSFIKGVRDKLPF